jgi:hypothetical protein
VAVVLGLASLGSFCDTVSHRWMRSGVPVPTFGAAGLAAAAAGFASFFASFTGPEGPIGNTG